MSILLPRPDYQGLSPELSTNADAPTTILVVPEDACWPAHIRADNVHASGTAYLKWIPIGQGGRVATDNYSQRFLPGEGYSWDVPYRGSKLVAFGTTTGMRLSTDAGWSYIGERE